MRASAALLLLLGLVGCRAPALVGTGGEVAMAPARVEFPRTLVGDSARATVVFTNQSRARRSVGLELQAPFSGPSFVELGGGESAAVELLFLPTAVGSFAQRVTVTSEQQTLSLELDGVAIAPVDCPAGPAPCRAMRATAEGTCIEVNAPESSACSTACVEAGVCELGQCVGQLRRCDDQNACTTDACAEATGCLHAEVPCAAPMNPCEAAVCDPLTGCGAVEVVDGTACGENTCVTAKVCLSGVCREVTAPEGSSCAPASTCQAAGRCEQGRCAQPPPAPLTPAWRYQAPAGVTLTFTGVGDRSGNVYWLESTGTTTQLVSVARDGVERFRRPVAGAPNPGSTYPVETSPLFLSSDTQLVLLLRDPGGANTNQHRIEARSAIDGSLQWARGRADLATPLGLNPGVPLWMMSGGAVSTPPRIFLNLRINEGGAAWSSWIVALEPSTGAFLWKQPSTYLAATIADDEGIYTYEDLWRHELIAISAATGARRWSLDVTGSAAIPVGAFGGSVYTLYPSVIRDANTGAANLTPAMMSWSPRHTLIADGRVIATDSNSLCPRWLTFFDVSTPAVAPLSWESPRVAALNRSACLASPLVTSRQSVLVATREAPTLYELRYDGTTRLSCPLPIAPAGAAVLARGRWVTSTTNGGVEAFDVPAQEVASQGWVTAGGSLDRANRPAR